jgi:hypothetical protein
MSTVTKKVASDLRQNLAGFEKVFGVLAYTRSKSFSDVTVYVFPLVEWEPYTSYSYVDRGLVEAYTVQVPRPSTEVPQEIRSGVDMVLQSIDGRDHVADEPKGEFLQRLCRMGLFPFEWGTLHEADPGSILYWQLAALPVKEVSA